MDMAIGKYMHEFNISWIKNSNTTQFVPVVPHKAVAEVSKIGNL